MPQIGIFGTYHVDKPSKVKEELSEFADDIDVIFIESPEDEVEIQGQVEYLLRNPSLWLGSWLISLLWSTIGFILTRQRDSVDGYVARQVAKEKEVDIVPVDMNIVADLSDVRILVTVLSWIWFIFAVSSLVSTVSGLTSLVQFQLFGADVIESVLIFLLIGLLPVVTWAYTTDSERNKIMSENITKHLCENDSLENGCLVVGNDHLEIQDNLKDTPVEVNKTHKSKWLRK